MMQHDMLNAMHEKLMLGVVIKVGLGNDIKGYQTQPEKNFPDKMLAASGAPPDIKRRRTDADGNHRNRWLPGYKPFEHINLRHGSYAAHRSGFSHRNRPA